MIYGSQDGHIDGITLKDVSVDLVKNSKWPCDGYDIRPCDGDGLLKSPIYGVYMRNVNNVTMENVHSKAQEGFLMVVKSQRNNKQDEAGKGIFINENEREENTMKIGFIGLGIMGKPDG